MWGARFVRGIEMQAVARLEAGGVHCCLRGGIFYGSQVQSRSLGRR
jgi:hypothetical protein